MEQNKPMIIAIEEAEQILVGATNQILSSGVTPYFLSMIFDKVYAKVKELSNEEMNTVRANWQKQIADSEAKKSENPQE